MRVKKGEAFSSYGRTAALPRFAVGRLVGHDGGPIPLVRITEDGKYCLTAGADKTIRLWNPSRIDPAFPPPTASFPLDDQQDVPVDNLPRALPIQSYEVRHAASAIAIGPSSQHLLVGSNKAALLIDCVTKQILRQWHGHTSTVQSVDIVTSPQHGPELIATASYDATVCLWDARSNNPRPIQTLRDAKDAVSVVQLHNQSRIYTTSIDGCFRTYDLRQGRVTCDDCHSPLTDLAVSSSGAHVAVSGLDGAIRIVRPDDTATKTISPVAVYRQGHTAGRYGLECCYMGKNTADRVIVSGSEDGRAVLYGGGNSNKNQVVVAELMGHTAPTCSVASGPDDGMVITASYDGQCVVWASSHDVMRWTD